MPEEKKKFSVLGIMVNATTYAQAIAQIMQMAETRQPLSGTALAVHGLMTGVLDAQFRFRLNQFELITPDGQPGRWALRLLYGVRLPNRICGPTLMLHLSETAAQRGIGIYLYGSEAATLALLHAKLKTMFPELRVCGGEPSKFRSLNEAEFVEVAERIKASGAQLVFVGLGCPRQEIWA